MTDTKWPKCQPNLKVCTRISVPESTVRFPGTDDPDAGVWSRQVTVSDAHRERPGHVNYTRTDIAEARIAELEAERDTLLRDCWEACGGKGPDSSDDELVGTIDTMRVGIERLRAQRDALRARIEDAPSRIAEMGAWDVAPQKAFLSAILPQSYAGKRVALVVKND